MRKAWDERYRHHGPTLRASMLKALPEILNRYLHLWQITQIARIIPEKREARVLDAGCGYGRIASSLVQSTPQLSVVGLDGSDYSIRLFNGYVGANGMGCVGNIAYLPFATESFDNVIMVTALMYLAEPSLQVGAIQELVRVMRRGGRGVIIENNRVGLYISGLALVARAGVVARRLDPALAAVVFDYGRIGTLIEGANGTLLRTAGCPVFTASLPLLLGLTLLSQKLASGVLLACRFLDALLEAASRFSLYVCYEFEKE